MKKRSEHSSIILRKGRKWVFFDQIDSTNARAAALLDELGLSSRDVIYTDYQTEGRGQRGKNWQSTPKLNVAMTYLFQTNSWPVSRVFQLNQLISLAVHDTISNWVDPKRIRIKWPNDIYIGQKKVAGILIQNVLSGNKVQLAMIGIGVNVAQKVFDKELVNATSIANEAVGEVAPSQVLDALVEALDDQLALLREEHAEAVRTKYHDLLYKKGVTSRFLIDGIAKDGTIFGVDDQGKLLVKMDGAMRSFLFGQIAYDQSSDIDNWR